MPSVFLCHHTGRVTVITHKLTRSQPPGAVTTREHAKQIPAGTRGHVDAPHLHRQILTLHAKHDLQKMDI